MKDKKQDFSIIIIGAGRVGAALTYYFTTNGYKIISLVENNAKRYEYLKAKFEWNFLDSELKPEKLINSKQIILAVEDDSIAKVSQNFVQKFSKNLSNKIIIHTSGMHSCDVLLNLKKQGAFVGSIHPIYSFSYDPLENDLLDKIWFSIEGDYITIKTFKKLFRSLGNNYIEVSAEEKSALHLACVFYANFYVALAEMSQRITLDTIRNQENIFRFLNPLLLSTIRQISRVGTAAGLTGPIKRGELSTITKHLHYLHKNHANLVEPYVVMSQRLLELSDCGDQKKSEIKKLFYNI